MILLNRGGITRWRIDYRETHPAITFHTRYQFSFFTHLNGYQFDQACLHFYLPMELEITRIPFNPGKY
jgi:hypothetical protein